MLIEQSCVCTIFFSIDDGLTFIRSSELWILEIADLKGYIDKLCIFEIPWRLWRGFLTCRYLNYVLSRVDVISLRSLSHRYMTPSFYWYRTLPGTFRSFKKINEPMTSAYIYIYIYIYSIYSIFVYHLYIPLCASFVLKTRNTGEKSDWLRSKKKKKGLVDAWLRSKMQSWFPGKQCGSSQFFLKFTHLQRISVLN